MARLSIQDIAKAVADKHKLSKADAEVFVSAFFDTINEGLDIDKAVKVKGLGTFKVIDVKGRESVNVNTGERVLIEGHGKITFTPDTIMRDLVNKPFAQFETVALNDGVSIDELNTIDADENTTEDIEEDEETPQEDELTINQTEESVNSIAKEEATATQEENVVTDEAVTQETPKQQEEEETVEPKQEVETEDVTENITTEEAGTEDEQGDNAEPQASEEPQEEPQRHKSYTKPLLITLLFVFVAAAALIAGYYWGYGTSKPTAEQVRPTPTAKPTKAAVKADTTTAKDTAAVKPQEPTIKPDPADETTETEPKQVQKESEPKAEEPSANDNLAMRNAKAIVRTGAYRIVGTSQTVTVKKGESLKRLSKFYLGDDMECYIQVHNSVTKIKEGMTLKIPKLELKKKKRTHK